MINVSNDTGLLPPGCPVRSMKLTLGTIVSPPKNNEYKKLSRTNIHRENSQRTSKNKTKMVSDLW